MIERHSRSRVEYMVKARSQFKERSTATSVEIELPLPPDAIDPAARTSMGTAQYAPEREALLWKIKSVPGGKVRPGCFFGIGCIHCKQLSSGSIHGEVALSSVSHHTSGERSLHEGYL